MTKRIVIAKLLAPLFSAGLVLAGCGDDGGGSSRRKRPKAPPPKTTVIGGNKANTFEVYRKIEDVAVVESAQRCQKKCTKSKIPPQECINRCLVKSAWDMRHNYKSAQDAPRDPFYSYVLKTDSPTDGVTSNTTVAENYCPLKDMRAPDLREHVKDPRARRAYSYKSLKLKGIIGRGTRRMALFVDSTGFAHIVRKGNCIGKEKARVREVGVEMVQLEIKTDDDKPPQKLDPIELHRKEIIDDGSIPDVKPEGDVPPKTQPPPGVLNRKRGQPPPGVKKR